MYACVYVNELCVCADVHKAKYLQKTLSQHIIRDIFVFLYNYAEYDIFDFIFYDFLNW